MDRKPRPGCRGGVYVLVCISQYCQALDGAVFMRGFGTGPRGCGKGTERRGQGPPSGFSWVGSEGSVHHRLQGRCRSVPTIQGRRLRNGGDLAGIPEAPCSLRWGKIPAGALTPSRTRV